MKLLLTNHELDVARGGTQIFIMDLARELQTRGHEVAVYTLRRGLLAEELRASGVPVVGTPRDCGFVPEVIHGQHHLATMTALCAWPGVPAVYHCHGYSPWEERPPAHPRIRRYVGMARVMAHWMAGVTGRPPEEIVTVPNTVHLGRFQRVRKLGLHPRHALVFGNTFIPGEHLSKLRKACALCGMTLDWVGAAYGNPSDAPQDILPGYDVVFAIGRCALEALASGCAVIPFSAMGAMPMVVPEHLAQHLAANLTVPETVRPLTVELLVKNLQQFDSGRAAEVTRVMRTQASFERGCDQLEALYLQVGREHSAGDPASQDGELSAIAAYLEGLASHVGNADLRYAGLMLLKNQSKARSGKLKNRLVTVEQKFSALTAKFKELDRKWKLVERRLPGVIRRWLLRDLK